MAKKRTGKFSLKIPLILLALIAVAVIIYKIYPKPQAETAGIFVITPLEYGDTSVTGTLLKDTSASETGNFYILMPDNQTIRLDVQKADALIGLQVTAKGFLNPPASEIELPYMTVSEMTSN